MTGNKWADFLIAIKWPLTIIIIYLAIRIEVWLEGKD